MTLVARHCPKHFSIVEEFEKGFGLDIALETKEASMSHTAIVVVAVVVVILVMFKSTRLPLESTSIIPNFHGMWHSLVEFAVPFFFLSCFVIPKCWCWCAMKYISEP